MSAAETAQRIRRAILAWPDVRDVYGPQLAQTDQFFLRFEYRDGTTYALEITKERGE